MSLLLLFNPAFAATGRDGESAVSRARQNIVAGSVDWTGIEHRAEVDPAILEKTRSAIYELKVLIDRSSLTNVEKAKAVSIANALQALIESPEPEWRVILNLLSSPALNNVMGILNIILFIFQLVGLVN